ncbi:hypothetical protein NM208_g14058 [Fusarium decemcellulare]|uniref:Uncharacterized protein n=1 Tax=Fusarium decemcellulare TaxID=57161 RepID=A0ACC1RK30_9HYPO|nr:hypothetical protein NM208_g14058 [Fusarium decemcellulare]
MGSFHYHRNRLFHKEVRPKDAEESCLQLPPCPSRLCERLLTSHFAKRSDLPTVNGAICQHAKSFCVGSEFIEYLIPRDSLLSQAVEFLDISRHDTAAGDQTDESLSDIPIYELAASDPGRSASFLYGHAAAALLREREYRSPIAPDAESLDAPIV